MVSQQKHHTAGGNDIYIVIVAAGSGTRFGSAIPKQFLPLNGVPVLVHTVTRMQQALPEAQVVLVLSEDGARRWHTIAEGFAADATLAKTCHIVPGGNDRTSSVRNALNYIKQRIGEAEALILVHDGARPLVHPGVVRAVVEKLQQVDVKAVVPVVPLTEALAKCSLDPGLVQPTPRNEYRTVQTPQGFDAHTLFAAYDNIVGTAADDATLVAAYTNGAIHTVPGHVQNIKITNPADIAVAEVFLSNPLPY